MSGRSESSQGGAPDLSVDFAGIALRNPVLTASGTFGYGTEFAPFLDLRRIGGFVAKSLTAQPRTGNLPRRIVETPAGMLNAWRTSESRPSSPRSSRPCRTACR